MKIKALRLLWRTALLLHLNPLLNQRCFGYAPALCWIDDPVDGVNGVDGYYRGGILAQYCHRFINHPGRCLAPIDDHGHKQPGGVEFTPIDRHQVLANA